MTGTLKRQGCCTSSISSLSQRRRNCRIGKHVFSSSSPLTSCSICVLCNVLLIDQISRAQVFNHSWQVTFIFHQTLSVSWISDRYPVKNQEVASQSSSHHQIDIHLIILLLTIDNGHDAEFARHRVLRGAKFWWSGHVWIVVISSSRCSITMGTPVLGLNQRHRLHAEKISSIII